MPVRCEIKNQDAVVRKVEEVWPARRLVDHNIRFIPDYFHGRIVSIIGIECRFDDMGGLVHMVDDPSLIDAVRRGTAIEEVLSPETVAFELPVETNPPVELLFRSKNDLIGAVALRHVLPPDDIALFMPLYQN